MLLKDLSLLISPLLMRSTALLMDLACGAVSLRLLKLEVIRVQSKDLFL